MKLRDYLHLKRFSDEKLTLKKFAESIDMSVTHVSGYIHGRIRMSKKVARNIEKITGGEVTAKQILKDNPEKKTPIH